MVVFTSVAVMFIPPQLATGLFGMNVKIPYSAGWEEEEIPEEWTAWDRFKPFIPFTSIICIGIGFSLCMLCLFKKQKII